MVNLAEMCKNNPDFKDEDFKQIKDWYSKQPHLPQNLPDEMLVLILHSCYYRVEHTKQTIDQYLTLRTHIPEFFNSRNCNNEDVAEALKTGCMLPLEGRTKEGYKIIYFSLLRADPQYFNFSNQDKLFNMVLDATLQKEGILPGLAIVVDFNQVKLGHLSRLTLPIMKKIIVYLQEGLPVRLKALHFINAVSFIDKVVALMKPFMKKELFDMLNIHSPGSDALYDYIPKEALPNEVGGKAGKMSHLQEKTEKLLKDYQHYFDIDETMRVDETRRPGKAKSAGSLFGLEGSFRKLDLD